MHRVLFILLAIAAHTAAAERKPRLYVWECSICPAFIRFGNDWNNYPGFAERLKSRYEVCGLNPRANPAHARLARRQGIDRFPAFQVFADGQWEPAHFGYDGPHDLLARLKLPPLPGPREWETPPNGREVPLDDRLLESPEVIVAPEPETSPVPPDAQAPPALAEPRDEQQAEVLRDAIRQLESLQKSADRERELGTELRGQVEQMRQHVDEYFQATREMMDRRSGRAAEPAPASSPAAPQAAAPEGRRGWFRRLGSAIARRGFGALLTSEFGIPIALSTGGTGTIALGALFLVRSLWRRRNPQRGKHFPEPLPPQDRELTEAFEHLRLRQSEGRHPIHDAFFGVLAERELTAAQKDEGSDGQAARRIWRRIKDRFDTYVPLSTSLSREGS